MQGKNILLGISGGIAAYKCAELVRRLIEQGAAVRVVMTESAKAFITPLTMQTVSGNKVADNMLDPVAEWSINHIELAKWADLVLLAPATANLIAKVTHGIADDLLSTLCLATSAPIAIAPAMNQQMYQAQPTQTNLALLAERGHLIWGPAQGQQACGDVGPGRMLEPHELVSHCRRHFAPGRLAGVKLMITAGPTREAIDPVRYISNHSSGKMGFAIAAAAAAQGAEVTLVAGPVALPTPPGCQRIDVISADQMHQAVMAQAAAQEIFIATAAVADYRPQQPAGQKIKKQDEQMTLALVRNPDILSEVAALENGPFTVGFAAETRDLEHYARDKLERKQLDMIAANDVSRPEQGFNVDHNALTVFWPGGSQPLPRATKAQLAEQLIQLISEHYHHAKNSTENSR